MVDKKKKDDKKKDEASAAAKSKSSDDKKSKEGAGDANKESKPPLPPLIASGRRLERLLGGTTTNTSTTSSAKPATTSPTTSSSTASKPPTIESILDSPTSTLMTNPPKIVRRWLGTSSGAARDATLKDVVVAAMTLLDRDGPGGRGRDLLVALMPEVEAEVEAKAKAKAAEAKAAEVEAKAAEAAEPVKMDVDSSSEEKKDDETSKTAAEPPAKQPSYLLASAREYESYLLSLAIRLLLSDKKTSSSISGSADTTTPSTTSSTTTTAGSSTAQAWDLSTAALSILTQHMENSAAVMARAGAAGALGGGGGGRGGGGGEKGLGTGSKGLEPLLARLWRFRCLVAERLLAEDATTSATSSASAGAAAQIDREQLRADLVHAHRLACLRRDVDTQATLLNLMLRELLSNDQVEQAQKLLSNSTFPDSASNNQLCRYLYHSGRIQALRLEYTSAFSNLSQCLRKAPTNTGLGFRIAAQRLLVVVQLLMGEIPERTVFFTEGMVVELGPYMKITQAVRRGDLAVFHETVSTFAARLQADGTYTLISRLAHSVVKAGLRRLNVSYSRISLDDVASRLGLPSPESAEFVVAKAVRDGVIDATIDHAGRYVQSHDLIDVYATTEPAEAFHRRIAYCLTTHNDAVRGMRYPPDAYKRQLEASRGLRGEKDDDKTDEEKAAELEDELDEEY